MDYCIYLRKSRADDEVEKTLGQGETLARHRRTLFELSQKRGFNIIKVHEELVSGESLIYRPAMLELLKEVEQKKYYGVLVMDLQRLGRGDMEEQGFILKAFKRTNTKIITPDKTYDLSNEFDEEYSEFEAFMSRKEYKMINKRLQRGVIRSVYEGNYLSPRPPYGYLVKEERKVRTLEPHPEQSKIVLMIFDWYVNKNLGFNMICNELNNMGLKTVLNNKWTPGAIGYIIKNPVYTGKITWKKVITERSSTPGKLHKTRTRPESDWIIVDGRHKAIIDADTFEKAQTIINNKTKPPLKSSKKLVNCMAGLIVCGVCGHKMSFRPYPPQNDPHIICTRKCGNKSSKYKYIEKSIFNALEDFYKNISVFLGVNNTLNNSINNNNNINNNNTIDALRLTLKITQKELKDLSIQRNNLYDLLERGIYDNDTFHDRSITLSQRLISLNESINNIEKKIELENTQSLKESGLLNKIQNLIEIYHKTPDPVKKNELLKDVLEKVVYKKEHGQRDDHFSLVIYPSIDMSIILHSAH